MTGGNITQMRRAMDPASHKAPRLRLTDEERALRAIPEKQLLSDVRAMAKVFEWLLYHTLNSMGSVPGFPDLTLVRAGVCFFVELKKEKGVISPHQTKWLDGLARAGVPTYIWYPRDWKSGEIERILRDGPSESDPSRWVAA